MKNLKELMADWIDGNKSLIRTVINPARLNPTIKQYKEQNCDIFEDLTGKLILDEKGIVDFIGK